MLPTDAPLGILACPDAGVGGMTPGDLILAGVAGVDGPDAAPRSSSNDRISIGTDASSSTVARGLVGSSASSIRAEDERKRVESLARACSKSDPRRERLEETDGRDGGEGARGVGEREREEEPGMSEEAESDIPREMAVAAKAVWEVGGG